LILGRQDLSVQSFGLSDRVIDLTPLGAVYRLDLTATIIVPDVLSMAVAAATNALASLGLKVSVHQQQSSVMPLGVIISQQPLASTLLPPGATVTLNVSQGP
jgi:beta-lactam-binding protein with PASTA domain